MRSAWLPVVAVGLLAQAGCAQNSATIRYSQETGRLWGIQTVALHANGTVTLADAETGDPRPALTMLDPQRRAVQQVTLSAGDRCSLSDGHHVSLVYTLRGVRNGQALVRIHERTDTRAMGGITNDASRTVAIDAYTEQPKSE